MLRKRRCNIPCYIFECPGREHEGDRIFEKFVHAVPKAVITQMQCDSCGALAKRRIDKEIPTQALIGQTQISHATTVKGSVAHDLKFAFGETKENPDGSVDPNHRPFTTTGELDKFMNGRNNLGPRVIDQKTGEPLRDQKGNYVHGSAKLVKLGAADAPTRNDVRKRTKYKDAAHVNPKQISAFPDTKSSSLRG